MVEIFATGSFYLFNRSVSKIAGREEIKGKVKVKVEVKAKDKKMVCHPESASGGKGSLLILLS